MFGVRSVHKKLIDKKGYKYFLQTGESGSCANLTQFCGRSKDGLKVGCLGNFSGFTLVKLYWAVSCSTFRNIGKFSNFTFLQILYFMK